MQFLKRSWAEISISALRHNMHQINQILPKGCAPMAVVKADAYGHGYNIVCQILSQMGVNHFAVSNLNEAIEVRKICPDSEILILGYTPPEYAQLLDEYNIIQGILSVEYARILSASSKKTIRCHVKLDTGMGRIGLKNDKPEETAKEIEYICNLPNIKIEGIYTHFAVADTNTEECCEFTKNQADFIKQTAEILKTDGYDIKHTHFMNSAASVNHSDPASTLARVGIILYGLLPNYPEKLNISLKPVMSLKSIVSQVKTISPGTSISYGRTFIADQKMTVATVTIGYADGYPRLLSNKGYVIIHGTKCPILGRVCMDQIMVDVSGVAVTVKPNDIVTIIGKDGNEEITADETAYLIGTIGYEIVCGISKRVPRVIVD